MYQILKSPKHGNCTATSNVEKPKVKISLADFKTAFSSTRKTFKEKHIKDLKTKLNALIEVSDWDDNDDLFDMMKEFKGTPDQKTDLKKCIQYYLTGFVCKNIFKKEKCLECKKAFQSSHENLIYGIEEADLLNIKTKGGLTHPNIRLFSLFSTIESYFEQFVDDSRVYMLIVDKLIEDDIKMTFPCTEHADQKLPELVHYYVQLRMLKTAKLKNREGKKQSAEMKKNSKFQTT